MDDNVREGDEGMGVKADWALVGGADKELIVEAGKRASFPQDV
ncbi:MAG: hypothetical protein ACXQTP_06080 [Candidatus Methanofastidiosia archaeon]